MTIAFIGGTGPEGRGLALRLALGGYAVTIGSRDPARARSVAQRLKRRLPPEAVVEGAGNSEAVLRCDTAFLCVPYSAHRATLQALAPSLRDKVLVDVAVPVEFRSGRPVAVAVAEGSAAQQAQSLLPDTRVVAAFHTVSARELMDLERPVECDVIVCGDDGQAKDRVMALAETIDGVRAVDGGPLSNSRYVEEFTVLLLEVNRRYKVRASLRLTGL